MLEVFLIIIIIILIIIIIFLIIIMKVVSNVPSIHLGIYKNSEFPPIDFLRVYEFAQGR